MNERIKQLAERCYEHDQSWTGVGQRIFNKEKFAELIIGHATECVRDVLRDENSDLSYDAASQVQNRIKEFFGIKE